VAVADVFKGEPGRSVSYSREDDGTMWVRICAAQDLGPGECTEVAAVGYRYLPMGLAWNCAAEAAMMSFARCNPDYTADHDTTRARLVDATGHQHNADYEDSEPMYRVADGGKAPAASAAPKPSASAAPKPSPSPAAQACPGVTVPPEAYPGACGPRPADAVEVTTFISQGDPQYGSYTINTPSGNIGCAFGSLDNSCGIMEFDGPNRVTMGGGDTGYQDVKLGTATVPSIGARDDAADYLMPGAQIVPYGTTAYRDEFVCGSAENGLTCWSTKTHHGVFMSREVIKPF
jgi:hypothetical protein